MNNGRIQGRANKAYRWTNSLKSHFILFFYLLRSVWNRHMIQWFYFFLLLAIMFKCAQQQQKKIWLYTEDIFFSQFCLWFFFFFLVQKKQPNHYDIICVMILLFMAPHFVTLYPSISFSSYARILVLVKTFFSHLLSIGISCYIKNTYIRTHAQIKCAQIWM